MSEDGTEMNGKTLGIVLVVALVVVGLIVAVVNDEQEPKLPVYQSAAADVPQNDLPQPPVAKPPSDRYDTPKTRAMLKGMDALDEVAWVHRDGNSVYVGLSTIPDDLVPLSNAWVLQLNREWDFGAHLWFVPAAHKPGDVSRVYREVSARNGELR
ncbi:MAG: hypothetical protein AAGJ81_15920 [Verrucomicrobiota bacterium]